MVTNGRNTRQALNVHPRLEAPRLMILGHLDWIRRDLELGLDHPSIDDVARIFSGLKPEDQAVMLQIVTTYLGDVGRLAHRVYLCKALNVWPWSFEQDVRDVLDELGIEDWF